MTFFKKNYKIELEILGEKTISQGETIAEAIEALHPDKIYGKGIFRITGDIKAEILLLPRQMKRLLINRNPIALALFEKRINQYKNAS